MQMTYLVLASPELLHTARPVDVDMVTVVHLGGESAGPEMTCTLRWADVTNVSLACGSLAAPEQARQRAREGLVIDRLTPGRVLLDHFGFHPHPVAPAPLFVLRAAPGGMDAFALVRADAAGGTFTRITPATIAVEKVTDLRWLPEVLALRRAHAPALDNHERAWTKALPGQEVEVKFTVRGGDPWNLAADLHRRIAVGDLPGFELKPGDSFQQWASMNHLFEVTGPAEEAGYVSFVSTTDGTTMVKRKWFTADTLVRREHLQVLHLDTTYSHHVQQVLGLREVVEHPPFHRYRFDVNLESASTGNWFSIVCDRSALVGREDVQLRQVEIEYCGTRGILGAEETSVRKQLDVVTTWVGRALALHQVPAELGHYSKLSFLRDWGHAAPPDRPGNHPRGPDTAG
jgi:hypothetical protein